MTWRQVSPLFLILGLVLVQQIPGAVGQSATFDEVYKVSTGYALLREGDMRWTRDHPPLMRQLIALPLLLLDPQVPGDVDNKGDLAHRFFFHNTADADTMLLLARLPVIGLTLLLVCGVYSWARELWGYRAGALAALVAALDPNLIAHGQLATNDVGLACFFFLAAYAYWRLLQRPSWGRLAAAGLAAGLALASKFSAVVLFPVLALLGFVPLLGVGQGAGPRSGRRLLMWLLTIGLVALAVLVVDYGEFRPFWDMAVEMQSPDETAAAPPDAGPVVDFVLTRVPAPAPSYWYGLWLVLRDVQGGRPAFLWGQWSDTGWWYYFPLALLLKTPLATLILVGAAAGALLRRGAEGRRALLFLALPAAAWLVGAMASNLDLGYRYILPMWPFLFTLIGSIAARLLGMWKRAALLGLLGWLAVQAAVIFPHPLAYFNELAGGPDEGYRYLVDSNLDWGQDLKGLARYQREQGVGRVHLAYFGTADPDYYGVEYACMPSYGLLACDDAPIPRSGTLAISATCLQGGCTADPLAYRWLLDERPVAKIGYSIFVYQLP